MIDHERLPDSLEEINETSSIDIAGGKKQSSRPYRVQKVALFSTYMYY